MLRAGNNRSRISVASLVRTLAPNSGGSDPPTATSSTLAERTLIQSGLVAGALHRVEHAVPVRRAKEGAPLALTRAVRVAELPAGHAGADKVPAGVAHWALK